ncbi:MAG: hypothetical protein MUF62_09890 [Chitinophagaceae bacterium]|nr:hypothetical protein [Chitinophagaceae bacterium]
MRRKGSTTAARSNVLQAEETCLQLCRVRSCLVGTADGGAAGEGPPDVQGGEVRARPLRSKGRSEAKPVAAGTAAG